MNPMAAPQVRRCVPVTRMLTGDQSFPKTSLYAVFFTQFMFFTRFYFLHGTIFFIFFGRSCRQSQAIRLRRNIRARKDQKGKDKDALESIIKSLGDEEAANIKMTWEVSKAKVQCSVWKTGKSPMVSL